jgi:hypothetical protein
MLLASDVWGTRVAHPVEFEFKSGKPPTVEVVAQDGQRYILTLGIVVASVNENGVQPDGIPRFEVKVAFNISATRGDS